MWLASRILTSLASLGLIWFFWPFGGEKDVVTIERPPPTGHDGRLFTTLLRKTPSPEKKPTAETPLEPAANPAASTPTPKLLYRVVVQDGGTLRAGDTLIVLEGIAAHDAGAQCKDTNGRSWPCGARARAALRRLIQGRAVPMPCPHVKRPAEAYGALYRGWRGSVAMDGEPRLGEAERSRRDETGQGRGCGAQAKGRDLALVPDETYASPSPPANALAISARVSGTP